MTENAIKRERRRRGLTQVELAYRAGVSISSVQRWERGRGGRFEGLAAVLSILDLSPEDLAGAPDIATSPNEAE